MPAFAGDLRLHGSSAARVESNGDVRKNGSIIGKIEKNGDIRERGTIIGRAGGLSKEQAAALCFFDFFSVR